MNSYFKSGLPLTIDNNNNTSTEINKLHMDFLQPIFLDDNKEIALSYSFIYNSIFNVTSQFQNNTVSYIWDSVQYDLTLPDGSYSIDTISKAIQLLMNTNNQYMVDENGDNYYFLTLQYNPIYYACELIAEPIPSVLPAGWSDPNGLIADAWFKTPQLVINNELFGDLIGYRLGTYPTAEQATTFNYIGFTDGNINTVDQVYINCNMVSLQGITAQPNMIYSFVPDVALGEPQKERPNPLLFYPISAGQYRYIEFSYVDINQRPISIKDPTKSITVIIRDRQK
jgi:hypothetical protein